MNTITVISIKKQLLLSVFILATTSILQSQAQASTVYNYGEDLTDLKQAYSNGHVHFLQIGDSHTAGDYLTEQLRKRLQAELGDGGVGFAYPAKIKGQRNARHGYESSWLTKNSRRDKWGGNYPLGGIYSSPKNRFSTLNLTSQYYAGDSQNVDIVVYGNAGQTLTLSNYNGTLDLHLPESGWQTVSSSLTFPTAIQADSNMKVGGFWLSNPKGGVVSAMGINGATQDYWNRWQTDLAKGLSFSQANLVILAYGTNEAFRNKHSNVVTLKNDMTNAIHTIRQGLPNANILIIGAPESLKSTSGSCGVRANYLDTVQSQLQNIAKENRTLYWSWQEAMGGSCSMKSWGRRGLARKDGVHFTRAGYNKAANDLYSNLKIALNIPSTTSNNNQRQKGNQLNNYLDNQVDSTSHYDNQSLNQPYTNEAYNHKSSNRGLTNVEIKRTYIEMPNEHPNTYQYQPKKQPILKICSANEGCVQ